VCHVSTTLQVIWRVMELEWSSLVEGAELLLYNLKFSSQKCKYHTNITFANIIKLFSQWFYEFEDIVHETCFSENKIPNYPTDFNINICYGAISVHSVKGDNISYENMYEKAWEFIYLNWQWNSLISGEIWTSISVMCIRRRRGRVHIIQTFQVLEYSSYFFSNLYYTLCFFSSFLGISLSMNKYQWLDI